MPVLKKEIELDDGTKIWVKQASGMLKLKIETLQATAFRKFRHFGLDPTEWTDEQQEEFSSALDTAGGGMSDQISEWIPNCILDENVTADDLTSEELRRILLFVRGDDSEGSVPLDN